MGLLRSASVFSGLTLVSRVFGLVRDQILAIVFGPGAGLDAFWVAFKIPNFMRRLFAEGAFSQAFVPVLGEYKIKQGDDGVRELISRVSGSLALVLLGIVFIQQPRDLANRYAQNVYRPSAVQMSVYSADASR